MLRNRPGLTEAPPGRMDAGKGKQRAQIAAPWPGMDEFCFLLVSQGGTNRLHETFSPTPHSLRPPPTANAQRLSFGLCRCKSTPTCPRRSKSCRPPSLGRALASPWSPTLPQYPICSRGGQALMARRLCSRCPTTGLGAGHGRGGRRRGRGQCQWCST